MEHDGLDAVLFDMDGVVTDTARAHAAAWKQLFDEYLGERARARGEVLRPFDAEDYRRYVDGRPRYEGVKRFLAARGIALPFGSADDAPGAETICGLGNRKNVHFRDWLARHPVEAFAGTVRLVEDLRKARVKTAVFSASLNAEAVLRSAGVLDLFDARVDGREIAERRLPGKPDPAMLREAAARVGAEPGRTAVIEDATAGVEAAVRGGFGLAVGVDRGRNATALKEAGAQIVVGDPSELRFTPAEGLTLKTIASLPLAREREEEIGLRLAGTAPAVFLDYDGTLTPIVEDHTQAFLPEETRAALVELARHCPVAIVSGRDLATLRGLVGLEQVYYAGSHGFEIRGPSGWQESLDRGVEALPEIDAAEGELRARLAPVAGSAVERKRFSIAAHYRRVAAADVPRVEAVVDEVLAGRRGLRKGHGKKVFEVQPEIDWNKGRAVQWLLERLALDRAGILPVYAGDDITDEDAFRTLAGAGLTLVVRGPDDRATAADYALADSDDVRRFLAFLTARARGGRGA